MYTIARFVQQGVQSLADLQPALQLAMQLEFSTIPPYLCAQWSIDSDPGGVAATIQDIVVQEMYHFALAGNMLSAIGGTPNVANPGFIPTYPTNVLPGGIVQKLPVDLRPLTPDQAQVFMQIEYPEFPPVAFAAGPPTIGAFYSALAEGFKTVNPTFNSAAYQVLSGEATAIKSLADALAAISLIKAEGEGSIGSPNQPPQGTKNFAHYYIFKEIFTQKALVQDTAGSWSFTGGPIPFPTWYDFKQSTAVPSPSTQFNKAVTQLLIGLQACWTSGAKPSIGAMFKLQDLGTKLIQQGIRPEFLWDP
jgi:hypothetical protein